MGSGSGTGFTQVAGSQQWNLDVIGDWAEFDTDLTGDGAYTATGDRQVAGQFNAVNEVAELDVTTGGSTSDLDFDYDKAGNLKEQELSSSTSLKYTHDAWGRLVKAEYVSGSAVTRGEYEYNGLAQRVVKRCDHNIYDNQAVVDEQRLMFYSGGWQLVEERIYDGWSSGSPGSVDRIVQHVWGLRYIDDIVLDREDAGANGSYESTWYHLTDLQFSTVALIDSSAHLIERVEYTPYGEARHHWKFDVDGDGDVDVSDDGAVDTAYPTSIYQSNYNADADFDRDGDIDRTDQGALTSTQYAGALPAGQISSGSVGNSIGYCGYVFNGEAGTGGLYTVRFRHFDPNTGRWLERDPAGYADGMSLYGYVGGHAIIATDPTGQWLNVVFGAVGGFIVGGGAVLIKGLIEGHVDLGHVIIGAVAGAVGGAVFGATLNPALAAAAYWGLTGATAAMAGVGVASAYGGMSAELVRELLARQGIDLNAIGKAGAYAFFFGWIMGGISYWMGGLMGASGIQASVGASKNGGPGCFLAGTLVLTAAGSIPIEEVHPGDQVWSYEQDAGQWALEKVLAAQQREYVGDLVTLTLQIGENCDEEIACTGNHPFWVVEGIALADRPSVSDLPQNQSVMTPSGRWTEARWLRIGDKFLTKTGVSATVVGLTIRMERVQVYNLQVNRLQLYAVGEAGVIVHNSNPGYGNYWTRRAPVQGQPYGMYRRYNPDGTLKQVTTYDKGGNRAYQYDVGPGTLHGEGQHEFCPATGERGPHVPWPNE